MNQGNDTRPEPAMFYLEHLVFASALRNRHLPVASAVPQVQVKLLRGLDTAAMQLSAAGYSPEEVRAIELPIVALLDESVFERAELRGAWNPLQEQRLGHSRAGHEVFSVLRGLRESRENEPSILRVYQLCLDLGLVGEYANRQEALTRLREGLEAQLRSDASIAAVRSEPLGPAGTVSFNSQRFFPRHVVLTLLIALSLCWLTAFLSLKYKSNSIIRMLDAQSQNIANNAR
jgi:type VI secretion system protein ImpK